MIRSLRDYISYWYLQYALITNIYMFEPWEQIFIHVFLACILGLVSYSSYVYLPRYLISVWRYYTEIINDPKTIYVSLK